jgi:hypothetical protein
MRGHQHAGARPLILASLLLALVLVVPLQAQEGGILEGEVVNETPGGAAPGQGLAVTLHILRSGNEVETREAITDAEGRFRFEGLDRDPALEYWVEAVYEDALYSSAMPVQFDADAETIAATIPVYESSDDDSAVRLNSVHVIAESFGQVLRISEIHMFSNDGDRTFAGSGQGPSPGTTVFIPLPANAVGVAFSEQDPAGRYVEAEGGVWDTEPVTPGQDTSLVFLSYHLMVANQAATLERSFAYPVTAFNILATQPGLALQSAQLIDQGSQSFQGREYAFYIAKDLQPGEKLVLSFAVDEAAVAAPGMAGTESQAAPATTQPAGEGQQGLLRVLGIVLVCLAVGAVVVYPLATRRPRGAVPAAAPALSSPRRRRLLEELADLEDAHEEGRLDEADYERQRARIYEALRSD